MSLPLFAFLILLYLTNSYCKSLIFFIFDILSNIHFFEFTQLVLQALFYVSKKHLYIDEIILYNGDTNKKIAECELYDPFKGVIPGEADRNIDYKSLYDPAMYSNSTDSSYSTDCGQGSSIIDTTRAWASENEGLIWWNLNTVKYIEYEQHTISYRNDYWGKVFPASTIDVYEGTNIPWWEQVWFKHLAALIGGMVIQNAADK